MPGSEDRQRAQQAYSRPGRTGLARRAVQSGQLVGARGSKHVHLAAQELGHGLGIQAQTVGLFGLLGHELGCLLVIEDDRRPAPAQNVGLGVLDVGLLRTEPP